MRIIHTGDLNIKNKMDQQTNEKVLKFINEIKDSDADLLLVAGDIVESGLEDDYYKAVEIFEMLSIEKGIMLYLVIYCLQKCQVIIIKEMCETL